MWPKTDADCVSGRNPTVNDEFPPPSAGVEALLERVSTTSFSDWRARRDDIQKETYRHFADGKITAAEFEQLTILVQNRDQNVVHSGRTSSKSVGQSVNAAVRLYRAAARVKGSLPRGTTPRKMLTAAELRERREKQGKRIYLAKVSIIAAEILQETRYAIGIQAVLARVVREVRNTGTCEQAVGTLAQESGASRRTVQMALRRAEADGLIAIQARPRKPNRITIVSQKWLTWIANSINRDSERIDNYGVSSKGAEICTLPYDSSECAPHSPAVLARRPRPSRESGQTSIPSNRSRPDTTSLKAEKYEGEPFEERLAQLESSVLAHSVAAARSTAKAIEEPEQRPPQPAFADLDVGEPGAAEAEINVMLLADDGCRRCGSQSCACSTG
ncbi:hypothetical protein [Methylobacterium sp. SI9]|uniref:hypothetical protein n=1 Tax=Methylobacterium guangdongense TaxID=3138811 RepID=UPI00313E9D54